MAEEIKVTVTQNGVRVIEEGDVIRTSYKSGESIYRLIIRIPGVGFSLVGPKGLSEGRVMAHNYKTIPRMIEGLNEAFGSAWEPVGKISEYVFNGERIDGEVE